jgi:hypothetical protein
MRSLVEMEQSSVCERTRSTEGIRRRLHVPSMPAVSYSGGVLRRSASEESMTTCGSVNGGKPCEHLKSATCPSERASAAPTLDGYWQQDEDDACSPMLALVAAREESARWECATGWISGVLVKTGHASGTALAWAARGYEAAVELLKGRAG